MQRIFKYGDIQNISLTSDKELNILIYLTTSYVIIYRTYALLKTVHFFGPPCIVFAVWQRPFVRCLSVVIGVYLSTVRLKHFVAYAKLISLGAVSRHFIRLPLSLVSIKLILLRAVMRTMTRPGGR